MIKEENIRLIFGMKLKQLRQEKEMNLSELAAASGMSVSYLNEIEKGKKYPKAEKIASVAAALDTTYDELVSLKMSKKLKLVAAILNSNFLQEMPLDLFGLELNKLADLVSNAPAKLNAFISTIIELSRNYDLSPEEFYFAALRSYQELYDNYFPEIEKAGRTFREEFGFGDRPVRNPEVLEIILKDKYGYEIRDLEMMQDENTSPFRMIYVEASKPVLYIHPQLEADARIFVLAKELGFSFMGIKERPSTSLNIEQNSFELMLNNFKSAYFATVLLLPADQICEKLKNIFQKRKFNESAFSKLMEDYHATPEVLMYRLTTLLPKFFQIRSLFFLRIDNSWESEIYNLTHELHLSMLHNPHGSPIQEHYCRRWISIRLLRELKNIQKAEKKQRYLIRLQRSRFMNSENQYFCISVGRSKKPTSNANTSVTIGILMNETFRRKIKFWNDEDIVEREVNDTCERCPAEDCLERAASPHHFLKQVRKTKLREELQRIVDKTLENPDN
ncbi:MAG: helix-turn-helix domain-containing protein [Chitinophagaceae bacterium]|nr:MAG: helix-turn-helix domain-containing protein [Chitinophagaceae bacterium]